MTTAATPAAPPTLTFLFEPVPGLRRTLEVHTPDEGQLAVWAASGERFQTLGQEWADGQEAVKDLPDDHPDVLAFRELRSQQMARALSRALRIIGSALAKQADRDWVEDCLLERRFQLGDALGILSGAVDEMRRQRAENPAAPKSGPIKKARRA